MIQKKKKKKGRIFAVRSRDNNATVRARIFFYGRGGGRSRECDARDHVTLEALDSLSSIAQECSHAGRSKKATSFPAPYEPLSFKFSSWAGSLAKELILRLDY